MGKASRDKGARYERRIAAYLNDKLGIDAARRVEQYQRGGDDLTHTLDEWLSIECKDVATTQIGGWVDQCVTQATPARIGVVIHHRRGNGDEAKDFATLRLDHFVRLVERARK